MQNCNLSRLLQFLRLDTRLTGVKCDCNGFAIVTVVNLKIGRKEWRQRGRQLQTMKKLRKLASLFKWSNYEKYFRSVLFTCSHVFVVTSSYCCFF